MEQDLESLRQRIHKYRKYRNGGGGKIPSFIWGEIAVLRRRYSVAQIASATKISEVSIYWLP